MAPVATAKDVMQIQDDNELTQQPLTFAPRFARLASRGCRGLISFGVAGGLVSDLRSGECTIASSIADHSVSWPTDLLWSDRLMQLVPNARPGTIDGVNAVVPDPYSKRELHRRIGAVAVDLELHLVARVASANGLSCATLRVVIDPVYRTVPHAAVASMRPFPQ